VTPAVPPIAALKHLSGDVQIKTAAGDDWQPAREGQALFENDKLRTSKGAGALVQLANGSVVSLGEDALVGISETRARPGRDHADVTVLHGVINAELTHPAQQSLSVSTPAATVRAGREIVFQ
jgi:hypothetical protein